MMSARKILLGVAALALLGLAGFGGWLLSLPPAPASLAPPPVPESERVAMLAALAPRSKERPTIAIVGINDSTETTDYLLPAGILRRADVADVVMLATGPGPVDLFPALAVLPDATVREFDRRLPSGADYVIVPAMSRDDDPAVLAWIKAQAAKGALIIGVCAGAKVVAAAGLLDGKKATTHWYYLPELLERSPSIRYVRDRRMVIDRGVVTTTGITASVPMMLTLIEAIGGRPKAEAVARDLGVTSWDARHASSAFRFNRPFATTVLSNLLRFWDRETLGVALRSGMDEVSLALVADAWSRTYRSKAITLAPSPAPVETRSGLKVVPDAIAASASTDRQVSTFPDRKPAAALDRTLAAIDADYGARTSKVVAMQLEYPR
jgi:putative intracellular protease/amidase